MTQEEKELLFKDLCSRLPYGVKVKTPYNDAIIIGITNRKGYKKEEYYIDVITNKQTYPIKYIKPYLRPMSLMTEQELHELAYKVLQQPDLDLVKNIETLDIRFSDLGTLTTWLNAHHLDYRGLIEKGLALEAPEGMYNIKD